MTTFEELSYYFSLSEVKISVVFFIIKNIYFLMNSYWAFYKDKILGFFFDSFFSFYTEEKIWTKNKYSTEPTGTPNFEPIVVLWAK